MVPARGRGRGDLRVDEVPPSPGPRNDASAPTPAAATAEGNNKRCESKLKECKDAKKESSEGKLAGKDTGK